MGHLYPENLDLLLMRQIYAKGKVSLKEVIDRAVKMNETVHCAEGEYDDEYMYQMALTEVLSWHSKQWDDKQEKPSPLICPLPVTDAEKECIKKWFKDPFYAQDEETEEAYQIEVATFLNIKWAFCKGGREAYKNNKIEYLRYVCM